MKKSLFLIAFLLLLIPSVTHATYLVPQGGTGSTTLTGLLKGNGQNPIQTAVPGTDYLTPTGNGSGLTGLTTTIVAEGTNLYFTAARVLATVLTGFTSTTGTITAADTVLTGIEKLNGNLVAFEASSSIASITTLPSLSLPYTQVTGVPAFDTFAYPFSLTGNATSTLTQFNGGLTAYASSTVGNGGANGLTINSNATTTGIAYFGGNVGVGTSSPASQFVIQGASGNLFFSNNLLSVTPSGDSIATGNGSLQFIGGSTSVGGASLTGPNVNGVSIFNDGSSGNRYLQISNSSSGNFTTIFGNETVGTNSGTGTNFVGINATSTPFALLSVAGSAGGTTPLFAISTSTAAFATSTAFEIDQKGNVSINNGASLTANTFSMASTIGTSTITNALILGGGANSLQSGYLRITANGAAPPYGYYPEDLVDAGGSANDYFAVNTYNGGTGNCAQSGFLANSNSPTLNEYFSSFMTTNDGWVGGLGCNLASPVNVNPESTYLYQPTWDTDFVEGTSTNFSQPNVPTGFKFLTNMGNTEAAVITNQGYVGISSSSPAFPLSIQAVAGTNYQSNTLFSIGSSTTSATSSLFNVLNSAQVEIGTSTTPYATGLTVTGNTAAPVAGFTYPLSVVMNGTGNANGMGFESFFAQASTGFQGAIVDSPNGAGLAIEDRDVISQVELDRTGVTLQGASTAGGTSGSATSNISDVLTLNPTFYTIYAANTGIQALYVKPQTLFLGVAEPTQNFNFFSQPTLSATTTNRSITATSSTVYIAGAPKVAASATSSLSAALYLDGSVASVGSGTVNAYGLYDAAPFGATNNYAAYFGGGNVGIGTSTPDSPLTVNGGNGSATPGIETLDLTGSTFPNMGLRLDTAGDLAFDRYYGSVWSNYMVALRQNGNIGIGTTSPATLLEVGGATGNVTFDGYKGCTAFSSNANGLLVCTVSDQNVKQDITPLDATSTLALTLALNPVSFEYKPGVDTPGEKFGLIAQQVENIFPNLVSTTTPTKYTPQGTLQVDYEQLIGVLVSDVQVLDGQQNEQEKQIEALQTQVTQLESGATYSMCKLTN